MEHNLISISNTLIKASYTLSLGERRLIYLFLGILDNRIRYEDRKQAIIVDGMLIEDSTVRVLVDELQPIDPNEEYTIHVKDYAKVWDMEVRHAREELLKAITTLFDRFIILKDANSNKEVKTRWISEMITYNHDENTVGLCWAKSIIPFISELRANFTSIKLRWLRELSTPYAMRLYEYFCMELSKSRKKSTICRLMVEDLKAMLELEGKYELFGDITKRIIEPGLRDINRNTNMRVSYKDSYGKKRYIKEGKRVVGVEFGVSWGLL